MADLIELYHADRDRLAMIPCGFDRGEFGFNVAYRLGEPFECILKACDPHNVRLNIIMAERQTVTPASSPDVSPKRRNQADAFVDSSHLSVRGQCPKMLCQSR